MDKPTDPADQLNRIEKRLNLLALLILINSVLLVLILIGWTIEQLIPNLLTLLLVTVCLVGFVFLFRKQIPAWLGHFSRWFFAQLRAAEKTDSMKDIR